MVIRSSEATAADKHVAQRLRAARKQAGISQEEAAAGLGITFQQLQKYEQASNRISAGKLHQLARKYSVPVSWFFEGLPTADIAAAIDVAAQLLAVPYGVDLARDYIAIAHNADRQVVASVAHALAGRA